MKKIALLPICIVFLIFSSCSENHGDLSGKIVDIVTREGTHCGKGVQIDPSHILTAKHIVESSPIDPCSYVRMGDHMVPSEGIKKDPYADRAFLNVPKKEKHIPSIALFPESKITKDLPVFVLVSRSGSWQKIEGKITNTSESYIGYDPNIRVSQVYTGAIETDILLESGESGTPIWTLSSELLGIMSAVDKEKGRSYIVRVK